MRRYLWTMILPMFLGCSGKNVVAGEEKTKAEQLRDGMASWCAKGCTRFHACDDTPTGSCDCADDVCDCDSFDLSECTEDCQQELNQFTSDEHCAGVALQLQSCVDMSSCSALEEDWPSCYPSRADYNACKHVDDDPPETDFGSSQPGGTAGSVNGVGGAYGSGGASSTGGNAPGPSGGTSSLGGSSTTGGSASGPVVTCLDATASGSAGSANMGGGAYVTCDETRGTCSDGHQYSWVCVDDAQGHDICSCFVDGTFVGALDPELSCPSTSEVNSACGWRLEETDG
jgi:hypothetical protein